ncbi:hypothetical protein BX616_010443 [Lobosporangium transversale]|nr:hypothetical protein BX616_010443 [Lobosporangium transversale]
MNTARSPSRNQHNTNNNSMGSTTTSRRAKVASMAQMDISSIPLTTKPITTRSASLPGSTTATPTSNPRGGQFSHSSGNNNGPVIGYSNKSSNSNNTAPPPRLASVRVRSSNSVATTASFRSSNGTSNSNSNHTNSNRKDGGSVTSDDGTVSEDSDLTRDDILHLLSGGQAGVAGGISLPFDGSSRHSNSTSTSKVGVVGAGSGGSTGRPRTGSSTVGYSSSSNNGTTGAKPVRMAAGASIKIDSVPSSSQSAVGTSASGSTVGSNPSSSLHLGVGSLSRSGSIRNGNHGGNNSNNNNNNSYTSGGGGDDASSAISVNSTVSTSTHLTTRSNKGNISAAAAANAAANKQAEDSRRAEEAARTKRKIADLEISNASLLSINQSLETTVRKQASRVQELETRLQS